MKNDVGEIKVDHFEMGNSEQTKGGIQQEAKQFEMDTDGMSLRLVSFNPDGKQSYSLVKLLQPYVLVGRFSPGVAFDQEDDHDVPKEQQSVDKDFRFELLTPDEEKVLLPKLEELCRNDLKEKGLSLHTP